MNPSQYHSALVALDQALLVFQDAASTLTTDERKLLFQLEILRSQILKAESGHPFPLGQVSSVSGEPAAHGTQLSPDSEISAEGATARPKRIRVVIADDYPSVRSVLRALLEAESDVDVVAEACNGLEAVELVTAAQPDVVIMDLNMPVLDGISATREALRASPNSKVLVFSANREPASVQRALEAGATGYLFKPASRPSIMAAMRKVYWGKATFPEDSLSIPNLR